MKSSIMCLLISMIVSAFISFRYASKNCESYEEYKKRMNKKIDKNVSDKKIINNK